MACPVHGGIVARGEAGTGDVIGTLAAVERSIVLQDLHAAAVAVHIAKAAYVHEDVEAKFLAGAVGAGDFVVASAMAQAEINELCTLRRAHTLNHAANLAIGMMRVLVEERGRQF